MKTATLAIAGIKPGQPSLNQLHQWEKNVCDLRITELPAAERAEIQREREQKILKLELDCIFYLSGIDALESLRDTKGDER